LGGNLARLNARGRKALNQAAPRTIMFLFRNKYKNIVLDRDTQDRNKNATKVLFLGFPILSFGFFGAVMWILISLGDHSEDYYIIWYIYKAYLFYSFLLMLCWFIFHWKISYEMKYFVLMRNLQVTFFMSLFVPFIGFAMFPLQEASPSMANITIAIFFISYICLLIYYLIRFNKAFNGKWGDKLFRRILKEGFRDDWNRHALDPNDAYKNDFSNKILNIAVPLLFLGPNMIIPFFTVVGLKGIGGEALIYFIQGLTVIITPYWTRMVAYAFMYYRFLVAIEKENGVTIYNGKAV
jgi:hypothetical protein